MTLIIVRYKTSLTFSICKSFFGDRKENRRPYYVMTGRILYAEDITFTRTSGSSFSSYESSLIESFHILLKGNKNIVKWYSLSFPLFIHEI